MGDDAPCSVLFGNWCGHRYVLVVPLLEFDVVLSGVEMRGVEMRGIGVALEGDEGDWRGFVETAAGNLSTSATEGESLNDIEET